MKKGYLVVLLGAVFVLLGGLLLFDWSLAADDDLLVKKNAINKADFKKGELIVNFKKNVFRKSKSKKLSGASSISPTKVKKKSIKRLNRKFKVTKIVKLRKGHDKESNVGKTVLKKAKGMKELKLNNLYKLEFSDKKSVTKAVEDYSANSNVRYAEPNYRMDIMTTTPDDPYYSSYGTWGQSYYDLYGLYNIQAGNAWDTTTGSSDVVVAMIDTGVDYNHADMSANMWTNTDEIPNNGIDDDSNGYVDDYYGYDFYNNDGNPMDDYGHGTHCAGTISAVTNNNLGVAGVSWNSKIMSVKFLNNNGSGYLSDAVLSTQYAVDNGAQILSNSWGGWGASESMQDAVNYAYSRGAIFVAAAGNSNWDTSYYQPAGLDNVFTVSASDHNDTKASFSNWGDEVDVSAPGVDTLSLRAAGTTMGSVVGTYYTRASGTSMATPHVSGVAALVLAQNPTMSGQEIENLMKSYADDKGETGFDIIYGYGRVNAEQAVTGEVVPLSASYSSASASPTNLSIGGSSTVSITVKNSKNVTAAGKKVTLTTSLGTLGSSSGHSNSDGEMTTTLTSSTGGTATVRATSDSIVLGAVQIKFVEPADTTSPADVTNFKAIGGNKTATLYWTNPLNSDFAGALIRRKSGSYPTSKDDGLLVYNGTGYSAVDDGLTNGRNYYYAAYAYDASDNYSNAKYAKSAPRSYKGRDTIPPSPVKNLRARQKKSNVRLRWKNPKNTDFKGVMIRRSKKGYPVKYSKGKRVYKGVGKKVKKKKLRKRRYKRFTDKRATGSTIYYYSVFSYDDAGNYSIVRRTRVLIN